MLKSSNVQKVHYFTLFMLVMLINTRELAAENVRAKTNKRVSALIQARQTAHVNMKTEISLQCLLSVSLLLVLKTYYTEKKVKWEALMGTRWLPVIQVDL